MSQVNVSFSDDLSAWAESRAAEARLGSAGAYPAELLRRDRHDADTRARLLAAIDEGLASPEVDTTIEDIIAERRGLQAAG
ncbi:type II toxin-antitoxin system ParD family antitoxin [Sphingomonas sp.]|uniref:ribbon-helix-helix domain-containing protein n=1 Tax=Sphingomonas sp. TaxID=28214 RepID=UPI0035BBE909